MEQLHAETMGIVWVVGFMDFGEEIDGVGAGCSDDEVGGSNVEEEMSLWMVEDKCCW